MPSQTMWRTGGGARRDRWLRGTPAVAAIAADARPTRADAARGELPVRAEVGLVPLHSVLRTRPHRPAEPARPAAGQVLPRTDHTAGVDGRRRPGPGRRDRPR